MQDIICQRLEGWPTLSPRPLAVVVVRAGLALPGHVAPVARSVLNQGVLKFEYARRDLSFDL